MKCNPIPAMGNMLPRSGNWLVFMLKGKVHFYISTQLRILTSCSSSASDSLLWQIISCQTETLFLNIFISYKN